MYTKMRANDGDGGGDDETKLQKVKGGATVQKAQETTITTDPSERLRFHMLSNNDTKQNLQLTISI